MLPLFFSFSVNCLIQHISYDLRNTAVFVDPGVAWSFHWTHLNQNLFDIDHRLDISFCIWIQKLSFLFCRQKVHITILTSFFLIDEIAEFCHKVIFINTLRSRQNGRHFPNDIFKCIFFSENVWISFKISLRFVPNGPINNIPALVQIMAWRRPGDKPLSEPMVVGLLTHIFVTRPQWVKLIVAWWH